MRKVLAAVAFIATACPAVADEYPIQIGGSEPCIDYSVISPPGKGRWIQEQCLQDPAKEIRINHARLCQLSDKTWAINATMTCGNKPLVPEAPQTNTTMLGDVPDPCQDIGNAAFERKKQRECIDRHGTVKIIAARLCTLPGNIWIPNVRWQCDTTTTGSIKK